MNRELACKVADAVLYEGYMLYPYRRSAIKNRQRWSFGILYPPSYPEVQSGTERSAMHSECLLETTGQATVQMELRFLHLATRESTPADEGRETAVSSLIDGPSQESWDEGIPRALEFDLTLAPSQRVQFSFPGSFQTESLPDARHPDRVIRRTQHELTGSVQTCVERVGEHVLKLSIDVANETPLANDALDRSSALLRSFLSAHLVLSAKSGQFVSLLDPPDYLRELASECKNIGNFPVLIGNSEERDMVLCSPIVLYDCPQIAPESAGDFYDATEMDEMLTLRVMTLTDEEKNEVIQGDDRIRDLLQRTEQSARDQLMRTHGVIRSMRPASERR